MSRENKTLFIRNLPFSTTKEKLEDTFSEYGPIKQCFIVTDRGSGKSKGFGYVQFTLRDDAIKAKEAHTSIDRRPLFVDYADNSRKKTKKEKLEEIFKRKREGGEGLLANKEDGVRGQQKFEEELAIDQNSRFKRKQKFEDEPADDQNSRFKRKQKFGANQEGSPTRKQRGDNEYADIQRNTFKRKQTAGEEYDKNKDNKWQKRQKVVENVPEEYEDDDVEDGDDEEQSEDDGGEDDVESDTNDDKKVVREIEGERSSSKKTQPKYHRAKIVLLSGLPPDSTQKDVEKCLQKLKVKHVAEVKLVGDQIHVKFRSIREAKNGIRKLNNNTYKDCELTAVQLSESTVNIPQSVLKRSRLIVRNLSFKCNEDDLKKAFEDCEGMTDASIPVKLDGKKYGFGFVQFNSLRNAMKAVELMNSTEILGRPVAVDWVLPKDMYQANQSKDGQENKVQFEDGEEHRDQVQDRENYRGQSAGKRKVFEESSDEGSSSSESDDDDDNSDNQEEREVSSQEKERPSDSDDDSSDENEDNDNNNSYNDGGESDEDSDTGEEKKRSGKVKLPKSKPSDVDQGKTIFIRNLSFDRDDEGLEEYFSKFGDVVYSRVVVDPKTEHSKGVGFVKFKSKDTADKCLQEAESSGILLDSRQLIISLAVSRDQSSKFNEKKKKEKKDNRNLYLAREGMIRPGTQAAEGLSKIDLNKRMKVEEVKRQKLKNINIFISPYRLCVRNIPPNVDDKQLKTVYIKAAGDKSARVTESRIMRDIAKSTSKGVGKSLGYGFVSFKEHQHALAALRHTNNNPEIFGEDKRLIVEFSLENKKALEAQQKRKERQKTKLEMQKSKSDGTAAPPKLTKTGKPPKIGLVTLSEKEKKLRGDQPKGPKGLPSHWGPKIRHKQRPGQQLKNKKAGKKGKGAVKQGQKGKMGPAKQEGKKRNLEGTTEGPERKKRKRNMYKDMSDNFDKMMDKYKQKIVASKTNKHKWFE